MFDRIYMGNRIRIVREQRKWTQVRLAARLEISVCRLRQIERGEAEIKVDQLALLAETLDVSMDYLATGRMQTHSVMPPIVLDLDDSEKSVWWDLLRHREKILCRRDLPIRRVIRKRPAKRSAAPRLMEGEQQV